MFGSQRRFVRWCECDTLMPKPGCLPHISQTAAIGRVTSIDRTTWDGSQGYHPRPWVLSPGHRARSRAGAAVSLAALSPADVASWMLAFQTALSDHRDTINRLNVYPVPDGDTGTNMHLTLESVVREIRETAGAALAGAPDGQPVTGEVPVMGAVCKAIAHGSLMGARGNSGVILCQILRGLAGTFADSPEVHTGLLAAALTDGSAAARAGVMRPVEGTILTVAAAAAAEATRRAEAGGDMLGIALSARDAAVEALARTPEQLSVLADAGVVDAGGAGLVLMFEALLQVVDFRPLPARLPIPESVATLLAGGAGPGSGRAVPEPETLGGAGDVSSLRYEVMYFLEASDEAISGFREVWAGIGDSIVVVGGDGLWNCHIHTDDIGSAVEAGLDAGRPRQIRVSDLHEQMEEESWVRRASEAGGARAEDGDGADAKTRDGGTALTSVVAVATGGGIGRIFRSLGVRQLIAGGQSMNPSTAQILEAMEKVPGHEVVVLPNNKNIFAVASQACAVSHKPARVVETAGIQEGFAALLEYDPEATADDNFTSMTAAAARVVAGEVTQAIRTSDSPAGHIAAGDWIGLSRDGIQSVATSPAEATTGLLAKLLRDDHEIVTIIEGAGANAAETRRITEWLAANHGWVTVEMHHGGQPLYPYLVSAE